jgi:hypothetical protein
MEQHIKIRSHYRQMDINRFRFVISNIPKDVHTILDVGAKDAQFKEMAEKEEYKVVAMDIDPKEKTILKANLINLPFKDNSFDIITAQEVLEHLDNATFKRALNEITRVARKYVIISVPHEEVPIGEGHKQFFSKQKLYQLFPYEVINTHLFGKRWGYRGFRKFLGRIHRKPLLLFNKIFTDKKEEVDNWIIIIFQLS